MLSARFVRAVIAQLPRSFVGAEAGRPLKTTAPARCMCRMQLGQMDGVAKIVPAHHALTNGATSVRKFARRIAGGRAFAAGTCNRPRQNINVKSCFAFCVRLVGGLLKQGPYTFHYNAARPRVRVGVGVIQHVTQPAARHG